MDDPLRDSKQEIVGDKLVIVLIPLLVDDPLRALMFYTEDEHYQRVLIPLLVDDPLRELIELEVTRMFNVLIPLLVDDPLRVVRTNEGKFKSEKS